MNQRCMASRTAPRRRQKPVASGTCPLREARRRMSRRSVAGPGPSRSSRGGGRSAVLTAGWNEDFKPAAPFIGPVCDLHDATHSPPGLFDDGETETRSPGVALRPAKKAIEHARPVTFRHTSAVPPACVGNFREPLRSVRIVGATLLPRSFPLMTHRFEQRDVQRVLRNWKEECDSAALYDALASIEANPRLRHVFGKLAASEREHAAYWEERLRLQGRAVPRFRPSLRTRLMVSLARRLGVGFVIPSITVRELADQERYAKQKDAQEAGLVIGERGHAAIMRRIGTFGVMAGEGGATASGEISGTTTLSNNLRASVLGANDGLVSNFCLMVGIAAGGAPGSAILLTGLAGMVAGACSMALGEWLSVTNARELARSQMDRDVRELHASAAWKQEELTLLYEAKGMTEQDAKRAAGDTLAGDARATDALIEEELVLDVAALGNDPGKAAAYSFALFALGALVPVIPFFFFTVAANGLVAATGLALATLFAIGLMTAFFNGRSALFSAFRQVGIGALAAAVTFTAGHLFGAVVR
jgi:VIT1/CCC1 family predicted Fe2+/Mn2+ transporter